MGKFYTNDVKILIDLMLMVKDWTKFWRKWIDINTHTRAHTHTQMYTDICVSKHANIWWFKFWQSKMCQRNCIRKSMLWSMSYTQPTYHSFIHAPTHVHAYIHHMKITSMCFLYVWHILIYEICHPNWYHTEFRLVIESENEKENFIDSHSFPLFEL